MKAPVTPPVVKAGRDRLVEKLGRYGLEAAVVDEMLSRHMLVRYPRGSIVFEQGAAADVIFLVLGGVVKIGCQNESGNRVIVCLAGPGDLIGFADTKDSGGAGSQLFEAEAMTGVTSALITREHLIRVLSRLHARTLAGLLGALNSIWAETFACSARMLAMSLRERLEVTLAHLAHRFGVRESRGLVLPLELGQQELAQMIGGSRPMVGKILQELEHDGVIARQGRQFIVVTDKNTGVPEEAKLTPGSLLQPASLAQGASRPASIMRP